MKNMCLQSDMIKQLNVGICEQKKFVLCSRKQHQNVVKILKYSSKIWHISYS